eukprot:jgi/Antlo1/1296/1136
MSLVVEFVVHFLNSGRAISLFVFLIVFAETVFRFLRVRCVLLFVHAERGVSCMQKPHMSAADLRRTLVHSGDYTAQKSAPIAYFLQKASSKVQCLWGAARSPYVEDVV